MTIDITTSTGALDGLCGGAVVRPGDASYDASRQAWNLAVDQRPALIAYPADAGEVADVVRAARAAGLRVAPQATGHNAHPLGGLDGAVLLRTSGLTGVHIDPERRVARVGAGVLWEDVVDAAAPHGLVALHGSSPDVGVVGYSLGGGMGWLARDHGLQSNAITAIELVTADGEVVRADHEHEADLFWALRGGGGNFGVVTALEFALYPLREAYAGVMVWDARDAAAVLVRWSEWALDAPDAATTSFRIMNVPPLEAFPPELRGRCVVMIDGAVLGEPAEAERILAPLRELRPEQDAFGVMPAPALARLHGDPEEPIPAVSDSAVLGSLPAQAVDALVAVTGTQAGPLPFSVELRQLGGALGRSAPCHGALDRVEGAFAWFAGGLAIDGEMAAASLTQASRVAAALAPWGTGRRYLNLVEPNVDASSGYDAATYRRLQAIRAHVDPDGVLMANHEIRP
jgi:FAD/FMN-containing dehydrogenase